MKTEKLARLVQDLNNGCLHWGSDSENEARVQKQDNSEDGTDRNQWINDKRETILKKKLVMIYVISYDILSLSDLAHLVWYSLGPPMLLQMGLFHSLFFRHSSKLIYLKKFYFIWEYSWLTMFC